MAYLVANQFPADVHQELLAAFPCLQEDLVLALISHYHPVYNIIHNT